MDVAPWCYKWIGLGRGRELWICPIKAIIHEKHSYNDNYVDIDDDENKDEEDFTLQESGSNQAPRLASHRRRIRARIQIVTL